jgi:hypothetical protein
MGDDAAEALLARHPQLFELAKPLAEASLRRLDRLEIAETEHLFAQRFDKPLPFADIASDHAVGTYRRLGSMVDFIDFRDCRRVVMVGCGRIPYTNFYMHDHSEVPEIVGIDSRPEVIEVANRLIPWLGYTRIRAEVGDGRSYDFRQAQVVFSTTYVSGKAAMLSRIADTAPENVQIAVREPYSLGRLWAESCRLESEPRLELVARGTGSSLLSRGLYLKRRGATAATKA